MKIKTLALMCIAIVTLSSCGTLTNDAMTPIAVSFSDGSSGNVTLKNKRGVWQADIPSVVEVRRSDDALQYTAKNTQGKVVEGIIPSTMGAKIALSALFLDYGIVDAITDKHREYPQSYVIPIAR